MLCVAFFALVSKHCHKPSQNTLTLRWITFQNSEKIKILLLVKRKNLLQSFVKFCEVFFNLTILSLNECRVYKDDYLWEEYVSARIKAIVCKHDVTIYCYLG